MSRSTQTPVGLQLSNKYLSLEAHRLLLAFSCQTNICLVSRSTQTPVGLQLSNKYLSLEAHRLLLAFSCQTNICLVSRSTQTPVGLQLSNKYLSLEAHRLLLAFASKTTHDLNAFNYIPTSWSPTIFSNISQLSPATLLIRSPNFFKITIRELKQFISDIFNSVNY